MPSVISAGTTTGTALSLTSDTSGELQIKTNNGSTTALTLTTGGAATFTAGSVSAPAITTSGDTNTGIFFPAADTIAFAEGGVESMRIDSSGNIRKIYGTEFQSITSGGSTSHMMSYGTWNGSANYLVVGNTFDGIVFATGGGTMTEKARITQAGDVGIGTSSPAAKLHIAQSTADTRSAILLQGVTDQNFQISSWVGASGGSDTVQGKIGLSYSTTKNSFINFHRGGGSTGGYMSFTTGADTERMKIDGSGNVTMTSGGNTTLTLTSTTGAWSSILKVGGAGGGNGQIHSTTALICFAGNQTTNGVVLNSNATSWASTSDERLKTNLKLIENAAEKVSTLRAFTGRFKTDEENVSRSFLIAQDVQAVLPEAVVAQQDEIGTLSLAYTDTIPLLVAAIQEQQAIITDLKARIETLESK